MLNRRLYEHYLEYCAFTPDEIKILDRCRKGWDITAICSDISASKSYVDDKIRSIKRKIEEENRLWASLKEA